jgi:hypothetical protein
VAAIRPAGQGDEQDLPSDGVDHPPSLPAAAAAFRARPNSRIVQGHLPLWAGRRTWEHVQYESNIC